MIAGAAIPHSPGCPCCREKDRDGRLNELYMGRGHETPPPEVGG